MKKVVKVHRYAYELLVGPIPNELWVLHHCDVPNCVRPEHLYAGTPADNVRDMVTRKRVRNNNSNRKRTVCDKGLHELTDPDNRIGGKGSCKQCRKEWRRKRYLEKGI